MEKHFHCINDGIKLNYIDKVINNDYLYQCLQCNTYYNCNDNRISKLNKEEDNQPIVQKDKNWKTVKVIHKRLYMGDFLESYNIEVEYNGQRITLKTNATIYKMLNEKSIYKVKINRNFRIVDVSF